jgi:hypothetical protein
VTTNTIKRTSWRENRSWDLQGLASALYDWLSTRVPGQEGALSSFRGFELCGTLDPADPDPSKFQSQPPPSWLTPEKMMQGAAAWYGASIQDFLFREGLAPLVRGRFDAEDGELDVSSAADVAWKAWRQSDGGSAPEWRYYLVVDAASAYPLRETSTISLTPIGATLSKVDAVDDEENPISSSWAPEDGIGFDKYRGWCWRFEGDPAPEGGACDVYVHIYA